MRRFALLALLALPAFASDFTGIYARIDRVVLEPAAGTPERAQVWGVFAIAKTTDPNTYEPPARGYLYFKLDRNADAARNEWNDLKSAAESREVVAFGSRGTPVRLRKPDEKPDAPDTYRTNVGVQKVRGRTDYAPVRSLIDFKD